MKTSKITLIIKIVVLVSAFLIALSSFSTSLLPPSREYVLKVNESTDLIVEGIVSKVDTFDVSVNESYLLFTFKVIYTLKDTKGKSDSTVQIVMKRNLEWEYGFVQDDYNNPSYLHIGERHILFLKEYATPIIGLVSHKFNFVLTSRDPQTRVRFAWSTNDTISARGFGFSFITLQDLYQFIKSLPNTNVPASLSDFPQPNRLENPYKFVEDSTIIKWREENIKARKGIDHSETDKRIEEKLNRIQKKTSNQRISNTVTLNAQLANPTFL